MHSSCVVLLLYFIVTALSSPLGARAPHETRISIPNGFVLNGPASASTVLALRVALVQSNMSGLEEELYAVSTPGNEKYGQHLTKSEVEAYVKPSTSTSNAVQSWLLSNSLKTTKTPPAGDWFTVEATVEKANELFGAEFSQYTHSDTGTTAIRTLSYSLPAELEGHVEFVHPTVAFPIPKRKSASLLSNPHSPNKGRVNSTCLSEVTPACLQEIYGIPSARATQPSNSLYVSGFIKEFAIASDLQLFLEHFRTDLPSTDTFATAFVDGGENPQDPSDAGVEADLDIQYTIGVASGVPVTFLSVGLDNSDGLLGALDEADFLLNMTAPPFVLTTSYDINEDQLTFPLANNLCNAYMQLGARGTSLFFASGDLGVAGAGGTVVNTTCTTFVPAFPPTCPFVTSIGGTIGFGPETAAAFSSGGFSNFFPIPRYQKDAVASYRRELGNIYDGLYNSSGRGFPDASAQAVNAVVVADAQGILVNGTSISTPIFASIVALVNDRLLAAGKSPLGFLNPLLYSHSYALTDITSGNNPGCNTQGFSATKGWDPVTGLGTPLFSALLEAASASYWSPHGHQ